MNNLFYIITDKQFEDVQKNLVDDAAMKEKYPSLPNKGIPNGYDEIIILKKMGFELHHNSIGERVDGKLSLESSILAECKSTNTSSKEWKFSYRAKDSFLEVCKNNSIWQLCGLWDSVTTKLLCVLCGTVEQILKRLERANETKSKDCKIELLDLLNYGFKVICVDDTPEKVYTILAKKYPKTHKLDEADFIDYDDFNKNVFYSYKDFNKVNHILNK